MNPDPTQFLVMLSKEPIAQVERTVALLWWYGLVDPNCSRSASELAIDMSNAGYPKQNTARLRNGIKKDKRTASCSDGRFRICITARDRLDSTYLRLVDSSPVKKTNSVLPLDLFRNTRGYIERVVLQINASYDNGLFDCCAVMCRRLVETLIIEAYETNKCEARIKGEDDHYIALSGLISAVTTDLTFALSRVGIAGLTNFKKLGDQSAHNRRFNARKDDIDRVRDGLRIAAEELLAIAFHVTRDDST